MAVDFAGKQGDGIKSHSNPLPTKGMGGKGKTESPVANFPKNASNASMPKGKTPGGSLIDSPVGN